MKMSGKTENGERTKKRTRREQRNGVKRICVFNRNSFLEKKFAMLGGFAKGYNLPMVGGFVKSYNLSGGFSLVIFYAFQ